MSLENFLAPLPDIALFAKMRSGKDEIFRMLDEAGFDVKRVAYGDIVKEKFYDIFPNIPPEPKPTKQIIHFGQSTRQIDEDVWVTPTIELLKAKREMYKRLKYKAPSVVFTDVRQWNEYQACKTLGCVMVYVDTPEHIRVQRMLELGEEVSREILDAPTEVALESFPYDYRLKNDGSREDLQRELTNLIYQIQSERGGY